MNSPEDDWSKWMRAANAGDEAAYRQVLAAFVPILREFARRTLLRYGRGPEDVEDVVQETLLAIHLKRQTWDGKRPILPWVKAIARNKLIDGLRRQGFRQSVPIDDVIDLLPAAETEAELSGAELERLLGRLQGRQAEVVRAISLEGISIREVGLRLGISEGAVRVALHRGLKSLASAYGEQNP